MFVLLQGKLLPAEEARVSIFDRGLLYGDGLFETIRVCRGRPFQWTAHMERLLAGLKALRFRSLPSSPELLLRALDLLRANNLNDAILRVQVTRGCGPRGYSIEKVGEPTWILTTHPAPPLESSPVGPWKLHTASMRLPARDGLAQFKTSSKLVHVMARAEAELAGCNEALLLNTEGHVAEAGAANVFWKQEGHYCTPALSAGGLAGVTRAVVMTMLRHLGWEIREVDETPEPVVRSRGVFLTFSGQGLVEVDAVDGAPIPPDPNISTLRARYRDLVLQEVSD